MGVPVSVILFLFSCLFPLYLQAGAFFRFEEGGFNGRIARTQSGTTIPFNSSNGTISSVEGAFGDRYRFLIGGSYASYEGVVSTATGDTTKKLEYGDIRSGLVYTSDSCCEWHLLVMRAQIPYTEAPSINTLVPRTASISYLRFEAILRAKAKNFQIETTYYLNHGLDQPALESGGNIKNNYNFGGCERVLFGNNFLWGPSICVELQELYLPYDTTITRQEVHGRFVIEF